MRKVHQSSKLYQAVKKIPVKNYAVVKIDYKESFWQSQQIKETRNLLLKIMVESQYPNVNLFIGNREDIDDELDLPT